MSCDYFHRLIIKGLQLRRRGVWPSIIASTHEHRQYSWRYCYPSLSLHCRQMAPTARRSGRKPPGDPYELSAWPFRWPDSVITRFRAEVRYHSKHPQLEVLRVNGNRKIVSLTQVLSRVLPSLTFTLVTLASVIESRSLPSKATHAKMGPSSAPADFHWIGLYKICLSGDDVYR